MTSPLRLIILVTLLLSGCTPLHQTRVSSHPPLGHEAGVEHAFGPGRLVMPQARAITTTASLPRWADSPPLSPGDRLQVDVIEGEDFSGRYEIDIDGTLKLPFLPPLAVAGKDKKNAEQRITEALIQERFFKANRINVSVRTHEWGHAQVHVSGAVFHPGMVTVNARGAEERALKNSLSSGDFPSERLLSTALRAAGGIRPDADLTRIRLTRGTQSLQLDYSGLIQGHAVNQVALMSGDVIEVPSSGRFNRDLIAPSPITLPGIRIFMSNLTEPATGNAISANCLGGTRLTNADRYIVLVRTDPLSGQEQVIERSIQDLLATPHRDDVNPFLMPDDSVSCFDSGVTNLRAVVRTLYELVLPLALL